MSRPRKPLDQQTGHLTQDFQKRRALEESLIVPKKNALKRAPPWLISDVAKKEWKRVVADLSDLDMAGDLDVDNIGGYCNAFALYVQATEELKDKPLVVITETGGTKENPLVKTQRTYAEEMRQFAKLIGLTIDSRLRFASEKTKTIDSAVEEAFGDI